RRDDQVAGQRHLEATAQCPSFDRRDQRLADHGSSEPAESTTGKDRGLPAGERLQVHARAERPARTGQHTHRQRRVGVQHIQGGCELDRDLAADGVLLCRTVDGDRQNAVVTLGEYQVRRYVSCGHLTVSCSGATGITLCSRSWPMSSALNPSCARTSSLCSPCSGARREGTLGSPRREIGLLTVYSRSLASSIGTTMSAARSCGSAAASSGDWMTP